MPAASATAVLAYIDAVLTHDPAVDRLHADAAAVAAEHGHELGEWYTSEHLLTAARCQHCTATVCLRADGHGNNSDPLRYLRERECRPILPRYQVRKITGPVAHLVIDSHNPRLAPVAMRRSAKDAKLVAAGLNGTSVKDPITVARAKVTRLRGQLERAEAELATLTARQVTVAGKHLTIVADAQPQPDGSQIPAQGQDAAGNVYYLGAEQVQNAA